MKSAFLFDSNKTANNKIILIFKTRSYMRLYISIVMLKKLLIKKINLHFIKYVYIYIYPN